MKLRMWQLGAKFCKNSKSHCSQAWRSKIFLRETSDKFGKGHFHIFKEYPEVANQSSNRIVLTAASLRHNFLIITEIFTNYHRKLRCVFGKQRPPSPTPYRTLHYCPYIVFDEPQNFLLFSHYTHFDQFCLEVPWFSAGLKLFIPVHLNHSELRLSLNYFITSLLHIRCSVRFTATGWLSLMSNYNNHSLTVINSNSRFKIASISPPKRV